MNIEKTKTLGLESVTIFNDRSYFFLFADVDTKDKEHLLSVLKYFEKWNYSVYVYETTKGYHIMSPVLLTFRTWLFRIESMRKLVPRYRFGALRISRRSTDSKICYFFQWNYKKYRESQSMSDLLNLQFEIHNEKLTKPRKTKLSYVWYDQLNYSIDSPNKTGTILLDHYANSYQPVKEDIKSNKTLIYSSDYNGDTISTSSINTGEYFI
ncbi:MAG TPA: hypothetical protein VIH04_07875 [Nitrosarchaeum sp.]